MNIKIKRFILVITIVLLFVFSLIALSRILVNQPNSQNNQLIYGFYSEPKNSLDVVFIGASDAYAFFESPLAWHRYGITSWVYAVQGLPIYLYEDLIREARKRQPNAVYVIAIKYKNDISEVNDVELHNTVDYMPFSLEKYKIIKDFAEMGEMDSADVIEGVFPILKYHGRWNELKKEDFHFKNEGLKGGSHYNVFLEKTESVSLNYINNTSLANLDDYTEENFKHLLEYLRYENVQAMFISEPQEYNNENDVAIHNTLHQIAESYGFDTLNLLNYCDEIGLITNIDYYNYNHTNIHGAIKVTDYLAKYLKNKYGFSDKRGNPEYISWDQGYEKYLEVILPHILPEELDPEYRDNTLEAPKLKKLNINGTEMTVSWEKTEGADGYKIYRRGKDNNKLESDWGRYVEVTNVDSQKNEFKDKGLKVGTEYNYTVIPYAMKNNEVFYGKYDFNGISGTAILNPPKLLNIRNENGSVIINWEAVDRADGYTIMKRQPGEKWENIGNEEETHYVDSRIINGRIYEYTVKAYTENKETNEKTYGSANNNPLVFEDTTAYKQ